MKNADTEVLSHLVRWVESGEMSWLCTVVKTWGSSPRPIGSLLCCNQQGLVSGSLSGGCVEEDLLERLKGGDLAIEKPELLIYGRTDEEVERFQLPCGGQLHIIIEPIADKTYLPEFKKVVSRLQLRECVERSVDIASGGMCVKEKDRFQHLKFTGDFETTSHKGKTMTQTYGPRYQLFLIGAGQVSMYLAQFAQALDYHVVVCDPREEMIDQWPIEGVQLINGMPDDAVKENATDHFSAIIALTHDPRIDDMGLMEALKTQAFFIGAMGSLKTSTKRRERLELLDLNKDEISKLHAPVGLPIGSKTPAEIAIAILAQLTGLRSSKQEEVQNADFRDVLTL